MKFEGTQVNVPIKGIMRAGTDNLSVDGAMSEVIGMEYKDGSWLPYKEKEEDDDRFILHKGTATIAATNTYLHKTSDGHDNCLFLFPYGHEQANNCLYYYDEDEGHVHIVDDVRDVAFIGNMLCVATDEGMRNFLWKNNSYVEQVKSNFPRVALRVSAGLYDKHITNRVGMRFVTRAQFEATNGTIDQQTIDAEARDKAILSALTSARGSVTEEGGLTGYVVACIAYRLKNGFVVAADAPVLLGRPMQVHGDETSGYREYNMFHETNADFAAEAFDTSDDNTVVAKKKLVLGKESLTSSETSKFAIFQMPLFTECRDYEDDEARITRENSSFITLEDKEIYSPSGNYTTKVCMVDNNVEAPVSIFPLTPLFEELYSKQPIYVIADNQDYDNFSWTPDSSTGNIQAYNHAYVPNLGCTMTRVRKNHGTEPSWKAKDLIIFSAFAAANKLQFKMSDVPESIEDNEIQSICIFMSPEISPFSLEKEELKDVAIEGDSFNVSSIHIAEDDADVNTQVRYYAAKYRSMEDVLDDIYHINSLYLVKEIPRADIKNSEDWETVNLHGLLGETLLVRESLPVTAFNWMNTIPNYLATYNYRLHAYDYIQEFYKGYDLRSFYHYGENKMFREDGGHGQIEAEDYIEEQDATYKWEIKVVLKDNMGNSTMVNYDDNAVTQLVRSLSPMITYPSVYADSMIINVYKYEDGSSVGGRVYQKEITLTRNDNLGIAYYVDPDLEPVLPTVLDNGLFPPTFVEPPEELPMYEADNTIRYHRNGLKASDSGFPNYFPEKMTYPIGNERIVGTALLSIPMSQDNYGIYQLIVFCADGIYTLGVNKDGSGAYTDIAFADPEVCINRESICEIGGAVIFASAKGLMMYSANGVEEFIPALNGPIRFKPSYTGTNIKDGNHIYGKMINNAGITLLKDDISAEDFIDYLKYAHVTYITEKHKLLVYSTNIRDHGYCYLIDIASRNATKLSVSFIADDGNNIGKKYWRAKLVGPGGRTAVGYSHVFEYNSQDANIDCMFASRPIKVQQDDKCSYRVVVSGVFDGDEDKWAELVVLGSLDAEHWRVIGAKGKKLIGGFHNLGCLTERGTWKYLMFIFAGQLTNKCSVDYIELTAEGRYNNKKR